MTDTITIALDAMGGDFGPSVVVPAALEYLKNEPDVELVIVGREEAIKAELGSNVHNSRLHIHHASEEVGMDELPSKALRGKKDSSMRVAINLVKEGRAQACVSAGNTGALMATARFVLKMLPNVDRPAIITALPSISGRTWVLDLGFNAPLGIGAFFSDPRDAAQVHHFPAQASATNGLGIAVQNIGDSEISCTLARSLRGRKFTSMR